VIDEYGPLAGTVALAGCLMAAASAVGLAWMRGARWQPPEETLPGGAAKFAALVCAVAVAILYVIGPSELGMRGLAWTASASVFISIVAFLLCLYINTSYAYIRRDRAAGSRKDNRVLGGYELSDEAKDIKGRKDMKHADPQRLFEFSGYEANLVWTRHSRAVIQVISTTSYLVLQGFGSIALASAAILVGMASASPLGNS
jgi:hypothetical protein